MNSLCVFEDYKCESLQPLVYIRPVYDIHCGMFSLFERITNYYPGAGVSLFCREYLKDFLTEKRENDVNKLPAGEETCLFINGRLLMLDHVSIDGEEELGVKGDVIVYARLKKETFKDITSAAFLDKGAKAALAQKIRNVVELKVELIDYFWDLINHNNAMMELDFQTHIKEGRVEGTLCDGVHFVKKEKVFIGAGSMIKPGCALDADEGPIYIGKNVTISSNSVIEGPVYIGDGSIINPLTRIRSGSNIGKVCKIGGEIEHSIIHDYSNKQHDGFLGNACLGSWVNLGADTINSNLKNTYADITIKLNEGVVNTGQMFLGVAIGDHAKSAINTVFMTGTVVGFGANIVTSGYPNKYIPSFTWCIDRGIVPIDFEGFIEIAEKVMQRRNMTLTLTERNLYREIYNITAKERAK